MNILITGGLGYVGGRIASYLKEKKTDSNILGPVFFAMNGPIKPLNLT